MSVYSSQNASGFDVAHWPPCLDWAERRGLWLFPVQADTKKPACKWKQGSSPFRTDWERWLAQGYMLAINAFKSGLILLDIDVGHVGGEPAWKVYSEYMASLGSEALHPYCQSASGGWHVMLRRPAGVDPEKLRGLFKPRMTSDARSLAEGEDDAEIISLRNIGYCIAPGSTFNGKTYLLYHEQEPHPCPEKMIAEELRLPVVEHRAAGVAGESEPVDVAALATALYAAGEFDDEEDWKLRGLAPIKLALGDTEEGRAVGRMITWDEVTDKEFNEQWKRFTTVDNGDKNLYRIGSMIRRAEELTGKKFKVGKARKSAAKMFESVVDEMAAMAGAKRHSSGGMPLGQGQQAVLDLGRPIVDAFLAAHSGNNPATDAPKLPDVIADHPLFTDANLAIAHMVGLAERSPRAFRADDVVDVLAVIEAFYPETFKATVLRIRGTGCPLPEGKLTVAVNRFRAAVMRACRTANGWRTDGKGLPEAKNADNVAALLDHVRVTIKFNHWTQRMDVAWPGEELRKFRDHDLHELRRIGSADYEYNPDKTLLRDTFDALSRKQAYDPVLDKINGLVWDGVARLHRWLPTVCHVPLNLYHGAIGRILIGGMVKRVRHPGVKHDFVPVLTGAQRGGKSTLCRILARDDSWFCDNLDFDARPENLIPKMAGKLVIELAEFDGVTSKKAAQHLKAFISTQNDELTRKYEAYASDQLRRFVLIATSNAFKPLVDPTGNTRYFPVHCEKPLDLEWLRANVDQLIAEAAHLEARGEQFALPPDLYEVAAAKQEAATSMTNVDLFLDKWFAPDKPSRDRDLFSEFPPVIAKPADFIIATDLATLLRNALNRDVQPTTIGNKMRDLGFRDCKQRVGIERKSERMWLRGKWTTGGASMVQHVITEKGGHRKISIAYGGGPTISTGSAG